MSLRLLRQSVFPPARQPIRRRAWFEPLAGIIGFCGLCLILDRRDILILTNPGALWLILLTPWLWWLSRAGHSGMTGWRRRMAMTVRWCLFCLLILILAQPRSVRTDRTLSVVYVMDASASITPTMREKAMSLVVRTANQKPEKDRAGLIFFGRDAAVELPPMQSFPYETINVQVGADGTNLEQALSLAAALIPEDRLGKIVLVTDGTATEGHLSRMLDELKAREIPVDVLPVAYDHDKEVWIERLELPRFVRLGESYEAAAIVSSLSPGKGDLTFKENGNILLRQKVHFRTGKNRFVLPIKLRQAGYYEYEATIQVPKGEDGYARNNKAISYLFLQGRNQTLMVIDDQGPTRDWEPLRQTLQLANRKIRVMSAYELPTDPLALLPYDSILFVNVPAEQLSLPQIQAVRDAVYHQGSGFLMVGGKNSFGPGGYHNTRIEELLPVTMDIQNKKILPKSALAITLHTCEFPQGNTWAKRITKQAIKVLGAQDDIGVLIYSYQDSNQWLVPFTPASQYGQIALKINKAQIGDMPSFVTTMNMALAGFKKSNAASRHMIIISDGDPQPPSPALLQKFIANHITVSTVAIFPHGTQTQTLRKIAKVTGGRFYFPQQAGKLPSIFIKEAKTLRRSMIQNKTFTPAILTQSEILKKIQTLPQLKGYVLTTPKPRSRTILEGPEKDAPDPVLATWRYGLGKTAAFTSDLSSNWAAQWMEWDHYHAFVTQLVKDITRVQTKGKFAMRAFAAGNQGIITAEATGDINELVNIQAQILGPQGKTLRLTLKQIAPRRYEAKFKLWSEGRYRVLGEARGDKTTQRLHGGFALPYSQEYLRFDASPMVLKKIAQDTHGKLLDAKTTSADIFGGKRKPKKFSKPAFDWLLVLLCCMLPLDIAVRRIHLDMAYLKDFFGQTKTITPSQQTFDRLLRTKKNLKPQTTPGSSPEKSPGNSPGSSPGNSGFPKGAPSSKPSRMSGTRVAQTTLIEPDKSNADATKTKSKADQNKPTPPTEVSSTTSRLLAIKRRQKTPPPKHNPSQPPNQNPNTNQHTNQNTNRDPNQGPS